MIDASTLKEELIQILRKSRMGKIYVKKTKIHEKTGTVYQQGYWLSPQEFRALRTPKKVKAEDDKSQSKNTAIQEVMSTASPEQRKLYHATGICAGDSQAENLLKSMVKAKDVYKKVFFGTKEDAADDLFENPQYYSPEKSDSDTPSSYLEKFKEYLMTSDDVEELCIEDFNDEYQQSVTDGDIKDTPDEYFTRLANYIINNNLFGGARNPLVNLRAFKTGTGFNLIPYVPELRNTVAPVSTGDQPIRCKLSTLPEKQFQNVLHQISKDWESPKDKSVRQGNTFTRGSITYTVRNIYKIEGLAIEKDFRQIVSKNSKYANAKYGGKNGQIDTFYHGTSLENSQFLLGNSGEFKSDFVKIDQNFGRGTYLAGSSAKASNYLTSLSANSTNYTGCLLICDASLGNCCFDDADKLMENHSIEELETKYDSCGVPVMGDMVFDLAEWKVNDSKAILPKYFVEIQVQGDER